MRILFVQNRPLYPANTGGRIRTLNVLRHLAQRHEVTYLCSIRSEEEKHLPMMGELGMEVEAVKHRSAATRSSRFYLAALANLLGGRALSIARNFNPALRRRAKQLVRDRGFDLVICDFLQAALHVADLPFRPKILFQHNVEAQIVERHAATASGAIWSGYMRMQHRRLREFERRAGGWFDAVIAVSREDRAKFERDYGWRHVRVIDTAVDVEQFRPSELPEQPDSVVFVGSLDWMPNHDGVIRFVNEVWPRVRAVRPTATFTVVGRNPSPQCMRLSGNAGVHVVGTVDDVRPYLARAAVVVVPLHVGGGTRLKIFEAMAMRKSVVATTIGAEGLPLTPGEHLLIADSPVEFAEAILGLLDSPQRRRAIGDAAQQLVTSRFTSEIVARQFETVCEHVVCVHRGRSVPDRALAIGESCATAN
jgi:sugar transferase (PEP-CTERM/EpsH1 system associated)